MQNKWILLFALAIVAGTAAAFTLLAPEVTPATLLKGGETAAGDGFMLVNQSGTALIFYDEALAANTDDPVLLKKKGEALIRSGQTQKAEQVYRQLLSRNATDPDVLVRIGDFSSLKGDYAGAVSYYDTALAIQPESAKTWLREGDAYLAMAVTQYREQHAVFLDSLDTYRKAMADYAQAEKLDPRLSAVVSARTLAADQFQAGGDYQNLLTSFKASP